MTPTSFDVARAVGVSQSTVSLVLTKKAKGRVSLATQAAVLRTAESMGYRPNAAARSLRLGRSDMIAFVVPNVTNPYFASVLRGAQLAAKHQGRAVMLVDQATNSGWKRSVAEAVRDRSLDGCILYASGTVVRRDLRHLAGRVVFIEGDLGDIPTVFIDVADGTEAAVAHLLDLGHRRIAHLRASYPKATYRIRSQVYRRVMASAGVELQRKYEPQSTFEFPDATRVAGELLALPAPPTAIFCDDDLLAAGVYRAARNAGVTIPDELSVVGFDDIGLASMLDPELTTVAIDAERVGSTAVELLEALLAGAEPPSPPALRTRLVLRQSTSKVQLSRGGR